MLDVIISTYYLHSSVFVSLTLICFQYWNWDIFATGFVFQGVHHGGVRAWRVFQSRSRSKNHDELYNWCRNTLCLVFPKKITHFLRQKTSPYVFYVFRGEGRETSGMKWFYQSFWLHFLELSQGKLGKTSNVHISLSHSSSAPIYIWLISEG